MPNMVPIAQVPLRGQSAISSQRAGPPPAAAAASSITPLNRQQEAEEEGEAQGALDREGQQADAPHQIEQGREAAKHLAALPFHAGESQQLGDAGGDPAELGGGWSGPGEWTME